MAQIYRLNVSLSFIKKSIRTLSDKLELSPHENKVRWKGGFIGTRLSSNSDVRSAMENSSTGESSPGEGSGGVKSRGNPTPRDGKPSVKAISTKGVKSRFSGGSSPAAARSGAYDTTDTFRYRPLMFRSLRAQKSSSADSSEQDGADSGSEAGTNTSGGPTLIVESGSNIGLDDIGNSQAAFKEGGQGFLKNGETRNYTRLVEEPVGPPSPGEKDDEEEIEPRPLSKFDWSSQDVEMVWVDAPKEPLPELTSIMATSDILPSAMPSLSVQRIWTRRHPTRR
ncbi:hypothetical protein ABW20_dc0110112 [Dactylellina cionopaga]|nr:hypothetical protein ABW20_dc0110112 [Dactylellina cionopaga]